MRFATDAPAFNHEAHAARATKHTKWFIYSLAACGVIFVAGLSARADSQGNATQGARLPAPGQAPAQTQATYVGSARCGDCHPAVYARWSKTRMANVVTDPTAHPEVIIPDLTKADPLLTFTRNDIAFVYGTKWKQRYFKKVGDDYFPLPAQWDVQHRIWRAYFVQPNTDWWVPFYAAA